MKESLTPLKLAGSAIGVGGVFLYSIIDKLVAARKNKKGDNPVAARRLLATTFV
jgi:hypothetical protein